MSPESNASAVMEEHDFFRADEAQAPPKSGFKSPQIATALKLLLSAALIGALFIFGKVDLHSSWELVARAQPLYLVLAVVAFLSTVVLTGLRWQQLAAAIGFKRPLWQMTQFCFVGAFLGLFLPSTVGGDFGKCYLLAKGIGKYRHALYSVLADRVIGVSILFAFSALAIAFGPGGGSLPLHLRLPIFAGFVGVFLVMPFLPILTRTILGADNKVARRFNDSVVQVYWSDRKLIASAFLISVVLQLAMVAAHIGVGLALGLTQIPLWYYFLFYPSVAVLGFVTPSINGVGVREWAYVYFLSAVGVDSSHALSYAILWLGLNTGLSLLGGLAYMLGHLKIPKTQGESLEYDTI